MYMVTTNIEFPVLYIKLKTTFRSTVGNRGNILIFEHFIESTFSQCDKDLRKIKGGKDCFGSVLEILNM